MALLRQWKYVLPLLVFLAVVMDIRFSSFIVNKWTFHFHHGWLYLLAIFVPVFAITFYFYSYSDEDDYTVKRWFGVVASISWLAVLSSYFLFHTAIWLASYTAILPTVSRELTIVKRNPSSRGATETYVANDTDNNQVKLRTFDLYWREGNVVEIDCVQIGFVCRITDTTVKQ